MTSTNVTKLQKRNTHHIGFNDAEFNLIVSKALEAGLYPRQFIMQKIKEAK